MSPYIYTGLTKRSQRMFLDGIVELPHDQILNQVTAEFGVSINDLTGRLRDREFVVPRQIAMFLIKEHTKMSLVEIGKMFNRDHSTVIYSIRTVRDLLETNKVFREKYEQIPRQIEAKD